MSTHEPSVLTVREVFRDSRYVVPVYQRAYAWGEDEITTLMRDVRDYRERKTGNYYIGSLVTHTYRDRATGEERREVVDGQQRLTTLFIILTTLANKDEISADMGQALTFEGRARSTADLALLARKGDTWPTEDLLEFGIKVGVETVQSAWHHERFDSDDLAYLLDGVRLVRTTLPPRTDLNHYFEIMNSRGEQLEKHEIVKAALMGKLARADHDGTASHAFARIWDACSDLSRHVQAGFDTSSRSALFGKEWDDFTCTSFAEAARLLTTQTDTTAATRQPTTLATLLRGKPVATGPTDAADGDVSDRYGAIIDFPNFLLHALALHQRGTTSFAWDSDVPVPLDDKRLVAEFENRLKTVEDVQDFAFTLLRARYHFDRYVIRTDRSRESEDDSNWVLHRVRKRREDNSLRPISTFVTDSSADDNGEDGTQETSASAEIVLLQSMFQVTFTPRSYKNFVYAILEHTTTSPGPVTDAGFVSLLRALAVARYRLVESQRSLDIGTAVPHYSLNYLDYLIWRDLAAGAGVSAGHNNGLGPTERLRWRDYRFRYRTSVEHFYPQHPEPESQIEPLEGAVVDRLGNLCLMSRSDNSKRSNLSPSAKLSEYQTHRQSLKFQLMAALTAQRGWGPDTMQDHREHMLQLLRAPTGDEDG